jgi:DNA-binding NtrC family response regulator
MRPKVLVVDDEANVRQILLLVLDTVSEVRETSNGQDALRLIVGEHPNLVLLDVGMPEMDGLTLLKAALAVSPGLRVVMLTGQTDLKTARRALEAGARAYITKPFDAATLRREIGYLLKDVGEDETIYRPWRMAACSSSRG